MPVCVQRTERQHPCRYGFTIFFNINNKQLLKAWMYPLTATAMQFFVGGCIGLLWFIATGRKIILRKDVLKSVLPLALVRRRRAVHSAVHSAARPFVSPRARSSAPLCVHI